MSGELKFVIKIPKGTPQEQMEHVAEKIGNGLYNIDKTNYEVTNIVPHERKVTVYASERENPS